MNNIIYCCYSLLLLLLMLLVLGGCQQGTTSSEVVDSASEANPVTGLPAYGNDSMPALSAVNEKALPTNQAPPVSPGAPTALLAYLSMVVQSTPELSHIGIAGRRQNRGTSQQRFGYKEFVLHFPPGIVKQAKGNTRFYIYIVCVMSRGKNYGVLKPLCPMPRRLKGCLKAG